MSTLTPERKASLIRFAVWQAMARAYELANAAGQDKEHKWYIEGAAEKFLKDAEDYTELLKELPK